MKDKPKHYYGHVRDRKQPKNYMAVDQHGRTFHNLGPHPRKVLMERVGCKHATRKLAGMKLVGFSLWRAPDGEVYVTFPSRAFGLGAERRFFDYLRASEGDAKTVKRVKGWIVEEFRKHAESPTKG